MDMRNKHWVIATSSYDRGNEHLLKIWPDVKKAVPDAQLHIFYGWDLFVKFYHDNPASMAWKERMDKLMTQDGVTDHGRVAQPELKKWIEQSGIWAYPSHFGEISCISAMKAQAWGAMPVVIDYAALQTTVQWGIKVYGDIYDPKVQENYTKALIDGLTSEKQDAMRPAMMAWARNKFTWEKVAIEWTKEFKYNELDEAMEVLTKKDPKVVNYLPVQLQTKHGLEETL
jgi:glycosyltransferase involved in cell wall biosynthesis